MIFGSQNDLGVFIIQINHIVLFGLKIVEIDELPIWEHSWPHLHLVEVAQNGGLVHSLIGCDVLMGAIYFVYNQANGVLIVIFNPFEEGLELLLAVFFVGSSLGE